MAAATSGNYEGERQIGSWCCSSIETNGNDHGCSDKTRSGGGDCEDENDDADTSTSSTFSILMTNNPFLVLLLDAKASASGTRVESWLMLPVGTCRPLSNVKFPVC